jgi:hypothetical protein
VRFVGGVVVGELGQEDVLEPGDLAPELGELLEGAVLPVVANIYSKVSN